MTTRAWLMVVVLISLVVGLGAYYVVRDIRSANAEIEAWSQVKYDAMPPAAIELPIEIVGEKFAWRIRYPSSHRLQSDYQLAESFAREVRTDQAQADDVHLVNELHLWKQSKVRLYLKSTDVPHSLFIPLLRLKQDIIPGQVIDVWLEADQTNVAWDRKSADWKSGEEWEFVCAEHVRQEMIGRLLVHETKDEFLKWLKQVEESKALPPRGR
jgi:cytochrome c oxidase subunit II